MGLDMKLVSRPKFDSTRALVVIHIVLALLLPFFFTQVGGCQRENDIMPVEVGPEVSAADLDAALTEPLASTDPTSIQLGEAFVFSETQEIAGGAASMVLSDTSQSVIERNETANEIQLTIIQHKQTYSNGEVRKTSTEIPITIEKGDSPAMTDKMMIAPESEPTVAAKSIRPEVARILNDRSPMALLAAVRASQNNAPTNAASPFGARVTYHSLKKSVAMEPPPLLVKRESNCLGIPNCELKVYRVNFDMVFWENGKPDRVHWELVMSPQAPYLAAMLDKCVTGLSGAATGETRILVKQCAPVLNFRYRQ